MLESIDIARDLRVQLPAALHACVEPLATVIADHCAGRLTSAAAEEHLRAEVFTLLRAQFAGKTLSVDQLRLEIAPNGDSITVGDISQAKGVAIGHDANAQFIEGDHNVVAAPGGFALVIKLGSSYAPSTPPFMAPDLPADFVPRPVEFERIVAHLLDSGTSAVAVSAALRGAGGFGKTTLAAAVCHDPRVRAAFPDGVLWVILSEHPTTKDLVALLAELVERLTGQRPGFESIPAASEALATALGDRALLLVVDDVWDPMHLEPFLRGGTRCIRLVTTRIHDVLPSAEGAVNVDAMRPSEARALLSVRLPDASAHEPAFDKLASTLGEWPILLCLVNAALRNQVKAGMSLAAALRSANAKLTKKGIIGFDTISAEGRHKAVARTLDISLALLQTDEALRFAELAIFPEDAAIPLPTLARYWGATGEFDEDDVESLCLRLFGLSLLLAYDGAAQTIRLHDVIRAYLVRSHAADLSRLHGVLLDVHRTATTDWADLPDDDPYLWDQLAYHLIAAGRGEELVTTVTDLRYIAAKSGLRMALAVESDLQVAEALAPDDLIVRQLRRSVTQSGHLLNACADPATGAATLYSRVCHIADLAPLIAPFAATLARPYLAPRHPLPDLPDSMLHRTLTGHTGGVRDCAISVDGRTVVSASEDHTVRLWDVETGALRATLIGHTGRVLSCAISADGQTIVSGSADKTVRLWDALTDTLRATLTGHRGVVLGCAVSADGQTVVSASSDDTLRVWDGSTGTLRAILEGQTAFTQGCAVSADGQTVVSASVGDTVRLWDGSTGMLRATLEGHAGRVSGCAVSADGRTIISASEDHTVRLWDGLTDTLRATLTGHTAEVCDCAVSADGQTIVSASDDHTVRLWHGSSGTLRATLTGHTARVWGCAISADGQTVVSASEDHTVRLWDGSTGTLGAASEGHTAGVEDCAVSADGQTVVSASADHTVRLWDGSSGRLRATLSGHVTGVRGCAVSADGRTVVSAAHDYVHLWNGRSGMLRDTFDGAWDCAVSADGRTIVSASTSNAIQLWDGSTGTLRATLEGHTERVLGCAVSADGRTIVSASDDHTVRLWDGLTDTLRATLTGHTAGVRDCAVSADGQTIVSASDDHTVRLWDGSSGRLRATLTGHTRRVSGCAVSADGQTVVSASDDKTVRLWDAATQTCLAMLHVESGLNGCACSANGQWITAAGEGGGVYFLELVR